MKKLFGIAALFAAIAPLEVAGDWTTFSHDPQRTGWAFEETTLTPANEAQMSLTWKARVDNQFYSLSALTPPVVATNISTSKGLRSVVYVAGISGTVFALDGQTGEELWNHPFKPAVLPGKGRYQGTFLCPNGITATPVIDKSTNLLYVLSADGALFGFDLGSGKVRYGPVQFVAAYAKAQSLNLVDGVVYTTLAQGCGNALSGVYALDVRDPHRAVVQQVLLSNTDTAGIWGRGGPVFGKNGIIYGGTADGHFDPIAGDYSESVVGVSAKEMKLVDYFSPPNWDYLRRKDFDLGSASPVYFGWKNRELVAGGFKEGVIYLMDANELGGKDHQTALYTTPRLGNDKANGLEGLGFWGTVSTYRDTDGQTWLFTPMGGPQSATGPKFPITNGENPHGSVLAFKVVADPKTGGPTLDPAWVSGDFSVPDPVAIANGVVFGVSTGSNEVQRGGEASRLLNTHPAVLKALDAKTGKELWNSGAAIGSWVHFSGIAIADGHVYAVDHDSTVYCFGLKGE
jgi:outer membrane protein assembly factor BamB